ncbi:MAG TPA: hypothetical protein PLM07_02635 [Candidatus Rifleibacterium sp.]|nr:hypothetical protein [Candidatus Rifleibacterium sp.]HPT44780.1 hypothetical protein [Candidatus Rifleibacterium sp.]
MSRSYTIRIPIEVLLSQTLRDRLADFKLNFPLLDILPAPRMQELVKAGLLAAGYRETAEGLEMPAGPGQKGVLDPASMEMTLSIAVPEEHVTRIYEESMAWMEDQIKRAMEAGTTISASGSSSDLAARMAREMAELATNARAQVNAVLKDVYREAIRAKASQIGTVSNVSESSDGNVYRIRVEIDG